MSSMNEARSNFGCTSIDTKIYVYGGIKEVTDTYKPKIATSIE